MSQCPDCRVEYERLASHWTHPASDCTAPAVGDDQREVLDGLMLAGATVAGNGTNRHLRIGTTNERLAEWTAEQLGWLCQSVRPVDDLEDDHNTIYRLRTVAHPGLNRYERWSKLPDSDGRSPPPTFGLTRRAGRVWWAFAGGLEWAGADGTQRRGAFSALHDDRAIWIGRILDQTGVDTVRVDKRVRLEPTDLERWLEWTGGPVPGVEYKWSRTRRAYLPAKAVDTLREVYPVATMSPTDPDRTLRSVQRAVEMVQESDDPFSDAGRGKGGYSDAHYYAALILAAREFGPGVSTSTYQAEAPAEWPSAWTISQELGWNDAKRELGYPVSESGSEARFKHHTPLSCAEAVVDVAQQLGTRPTQIEYDTAVQEDQPTRKTVVKHLGPWADTLDAIFGATDPASPPAREERERLCRIAADLITAGHIETAQVALADAGFGGWDDNLVTVTRDWPSNRVQRVLSEIYQEIGDPFTTTRYKTEVIGVMDEYPPLHRVYEVFDGWADVKQFIGAE